MNFAPLRLADIDTVRPYFSQLASRTCDFSVGGMFMWRDFFHMEFAIEKHTFFSRLYDSNQEVHYNLPISDNIKASIAELVAREADGKKSVKFCTIPEMYIPLFTETCNVVAITEHPEFFDYAYAASDLVELAGKKYSGQRNQINQFKRSVDSWDFQKLGSENIAQVVDFFRQTYLPGSAQGSYEQEENAKVLEVLQNMDVYGMVGGVLIADREIVGFSLNEIIRDTIYTHIEKADRRFKGAYQMLMNQTALAFANSGIRYINREEDMGDLGLRTSKKSYHPIEILKKYTIEVNQVI